MSNNPEKDYETVRNELKEYTNDLTVKSELLVLTKSDLVSKGYIDGIIKIAKSLNKNNLVVSVYDDQSLEQLKAKILALTQK